MSGMKELLEILWPLHRTINSEDMETALELCGKYIDDDRWRVERYTPHSEVFTWIVPERYHVREAWLEIEGQRVADFHENPLHLMSYSLSKRISGRLGDIRSHIWSRPENPFAIPWEFKYYERNWGFCVRQADLEKYGDHARVEGVIDVEFTNGDMCLGEFYIPGETDEDVLFLTNICHPYQVNDSLSGLVVGMEMACRLKNAPRGRYGFRLIVVPETIGTIAWFHRHGDEAGKIRHAWFCEMVGHDNSFILQHSRQGDALVDKAFLSALRANRRHGEERRGEFRKIVASDEIVSNGPGFDIPTPSLTRWPYDEYHTSDDNPSIIKEENLEEALKVVMEAHAMLDADYYPKRTFKGPVMLSRYGLWVDWRDDWDLNLKTEAIMLKLEGDKSVLELAWELGLPMETVRHYLDRFHDAGLITRSYKPAMRDLGAI